MSNTPPGWHHAQGDPPNTQRYWDGQSWQGEPQPVANQAPMGQAPMQNSGPMGQAPMGQPPMGQAPMGQAPMGQAPMGQATGTGEMFGLRLGAKLIDGIPLAILLIIIQSIVKAILGADTVTNSASFSFDAFKSGTGTLVGDIVSPLLTAGIYFAYSYFTLQSQQATMGKKLLGLKVQPTGGDANTSYLIRSAIYPAALIIGLLPFLGAIVMVVYVLYYIIAQPIMMLAVPSGQTLRDTLSQTMVVKA